MSDDIERAFNACYSNLAIFLIEKVINNGKLINDDKLENKNPNDLAHHLVPKILLRAHVLKQKCSWKSDLQCLTEAERDICDEKKADFLAKIYSEQGNNSKSDKEYFEDAAGYIKKHERKVAEIAFVLWKDDKVKRSEEDYWLEADIIFSLRKKDIDNGHPQQSEKHYRLEAKKCVDKIKEYAYSLYEKDAGNGINKSSEYYWLKAEKVVKSSIL